MRNGPDLVPGIGLCVTQFHPVYKHGFQSCGNVDIRGTVILTLCFPFYSSVPQGT